ncbi:MAG: type II secretion system F family protein [Candidatus Micrarchaeota archaeon]|nr:type II secretion system F family protein [Candidatus Micrarchaeota archaeon]
MAIVFERLVGRDVARFLSEELDLAGTRMSVEALIRLVIISWIAILIGVSFPLVIVLQLNPILAFLAALGISAIFGVFVFAILEFRIEQRKEFIENALPDFLQLTSANMRSGVALSKAMIMAVRPEFKYFGDDVSMMGKQLYAGDTIEHSLKQLASRYRSQQFKRTVRMIIEAQQYGGGMTDLLNQIGKDMRSQRIIQKEVAGQLFMYTIFIAFAALVGAPALYALTNQMVGVTATIWSQISLGNISKLPSLGVSFLKLSKPQITPDGYFWFSIFAIMIITGCGAFIISAITTGNALKGIRFMPVFIVIGFGIFYIVSLVIGSVFASLGKT